tara:strand:+ start:247 stop:657 length:411 start_codon:yes stop_codon:yes gene_type:complete
MSRVVVNEIEAKVGNDVKFNSNIANPTTVQGEGTATTNLQNGLVKSYIRYGQAANSVLKSLNISSVTDTSAGVFVTIFTNAFDGSSYGASTSIQTSTHSHTSQLTAMTASQVGGRGYNGSTASDLTHGQIFAGELA